MFNRENLKKIRLKIEGALSEELAEYGVTNINLGRIRFSSTQFTCRLEVTTKEEQESEDKYLEMILKQFGLPKEYKGYVIVDYNPRRFKYPFTFKKPDGKRYKCSSRQICTIMGLPIPEVMP